MANHEPACPVIAAALKVQGDLDELAASMQRLRRAVRKCANCPQKDCPLLLELSTAISNALMELTETWNV